MECYLHHIAGLQIEVRPIGLPFVHDPCQPGAIELAQGHGLGRGQRDRQVQGRLVVRGHGGIGTGDAPGGLGAFIAVESGILVAHREPQGQIHLLRPGLAKSFAIRQGRQIVLGDHPAGRPATLLELELVVALDRLERVRGGEQLQSTTHADLARDPKSQDFVPGELAYVQIARRQPHAAAQRTHHLIEAQGAIRSPAGDDLVGAAWAAAADIEDIAVRVVHHPAYAVVVREAGLPEQHVAVSPLRMVTAWPP
jgi:hypothetical protein